MDLTLDIATLWCSTANCANLNADLICLEGEPEPGLPFRRMVIVLPSGDITEYFHDSLGNLRAKVLGRVRDSYFCDKSILVESGPAS